MGAPLERSRGDQNAGSFYHRVLEGNGMAGFWLHATGDNYRLLGGAPSRHRWLVHPGVDAAVLLLHQRSYFSICIPLGNACCHGNYGGFDVDTIWDSRRGIFSRLDTRRLSHVEKW